MKIMHKKAFTLIELLVVIAIIGILVLLGAPRFTGYTQKAERIRIQHDVKVMEEEIGTVLINGDDDFNKWENNINDLNQLAQDNELFEKEGHVTAKDGEPIDGPYKVIPEKYKDKINTKLKGTFYAHSGGKVYYEHGKGPGYSDEEIDDLVYRHKYIPVATAEELQHIAKDNDQLRTFGQGTKWEGQYVGKLDSEFVQVKDIDLSIYSGQVKDEYLSRFSEEGWTPIGQGITYHVGFRGTYDGGNYVITGLEVKGESKFHQGLFGRTYGATIRNVGLIDNKVTGAWYVGGLLGRASQGTTIENSYATGSVTGKVTDSDSVGGLVGMAHENSKISNSYATGKVIGERAVGGLVGSASSSAIENSYATGPVASEAFGINTVSAGGLVGYASRGTNISNSYATGPVKGTVKGKRSTGSTGGLLGGFYFAYEPVTISNSYAIGSVTAGEGTGKNKVGGLVGQAYKDDNDNIIISNAYWNKETTGQTSSHEGGTGLTTDEMKKADTYAAWGTDVWNIVNGNYPTLR